MRCPICEGEGGWPDDRGIDGYEDWDDCSFCNKTGSASLGSIASYWFWTHLPDTIWERYVNWRYDETD
jgi:hypothetical protein